MLPASRHHPFRLAAAAVVATAAVGAVVWWAGQHDRDRQQALFLTRAGDFAAAEPVLTALAGRNPWDGEVAGALAHGYLAAADPRAEDALTRWMKADPKDPEPVRLRRDLFWAANDRRAVEDAKLLIRMECRDPDVRHKAMDCAIAFGMYDEAEERCLSILKRFPDDIPLRLKLAGIRKAGGKPAAAAATLDDLLKDHPTCREARDARSAL